jgi:glucokinase
MFGSKNETGTASPGLVLAVDLGGTHLRGATVDRDGNVHHRFKQPTPQAEKGDDIVQAIISAARESGTTAISALSVAVPGTIDVRAGAVVSAPNVPCLNGFPLAPVLKRELQCPVILENDANAAAVGEMWQGAGRGHGTIVCLTLGTGVGGGIILEGKVWRGADGSAAEIGHMSVNPFGGVKCPCGSHDCLEVYASATAIVRQARERLPRYPSSTLHRDDELTSEKVYRAGVEGDELALEVFRVMGIYLGAGLASLINLINPEIVIIGGGAANGWELFEMHMRHEVTNRNFPLPAAQVKIVRAECGDDAGLLGAAHLAFVAEEGDNLLI